MLAINDPQHTCFALLLANAWGVWGKKKKKKGERKKRKFQALDRFFP